MYFPGRISLFRKKNNVRKIPYRDASNCCCELWNIATSPIVNTKMPNMMKNRNRPARAIRVAVIFIIFVRCLLLWSVCLLN